MDVLFGLVWELKIIFLITAACHPSIYYNTNNGTKCKCSNVSQSVTPFVKHLLALEMLLKWIEYAVIILIHGIQKLKCYY